MIRTTAPLIERMTLTWHDWFATSNEGVGSQLLMIEQNHTLRKLAMGSFPKLFEAVTIDPAMLIYLSGSGSSKEDPNENYAREMQELFTLGVNGGYTERDVHEHARALTGWTSSWNSVTGQQDDFHLDPERQDKGVKVIYGNAGTSTGATASTSNRHPLHPKHSPQSSGPTSRRHRCPRLMTALSDLYGRPPGKEIRPSSRRCSAPALSLGARMVTPPIVQSPAAPRDGRFIDTDAWAWESAIAGQRPFYPPNVAGWEMNRWLNTGTWLARFNLSSQVIDEKRALNPNSKLKVTSDPAKLVQQATEFWGSPTISPRTQGALQTYAKQAAVDAASEKWEKEAFPVLTLNALRALVASTPDYHTC